MSERDPLNPANFAIPDLELEPPAVSKRPAPASTPRGPASQKAVAPSFGGDIAFGDDDGDDGFELVATSASLDVATGHVSHGTPEKAARWPTGHTPEVQRLAVDATEVTIVADYGPAPQSALLSPLYAFRVFARRKPLRLAIAGQQGELVAAEAARDVQLAQLAQQVRPLLETNDAFRRLLEPIREVERVAGDRSAALSQADTGYREQMARFDAELAQLRQSEAAAQLVVDAKTVAYEGTNAELRRAEAKHQRVLIEIRGVMDLARQTLGPAGGDLPPAQAAQVAELEQRAKGLEPALAQAKANHALSSAGLADAERETDRLRTHLQKLDRQKRSAGSSLEKQLSVRAAGVSEAEQQRREEFAQVARGVLAARGSVPIPEATLDALRRHDAAVEAHALRLETHVRALDAYDRERVKQGIILVLSGLAVVLLSICLKAVL